ncbi:MAG: OmpA family protein [Myxococcota bacterium]
MVTTILFSLALIGPEPTASGSSVEAKTTTTETPSRASRSTDRGDQPWIRRWAPERNTGELGVFGGLMFPHPRLELFEPAFDLDDQGFVPLRGVSPEVGARGGFYFLRWLGVEAEGALMPTRTSTNQNALVWAFRGQLVGQLPYWSVTPFVLAGASALGVRSERAAVGNDVDLGFHYGAGVKVFVNRYLGLRFEVRDTLTARRGIGQSVIHSPEVLLGLTLTLGRKRSEPRPVAPVDLDADGDGILDRDDRCPNTPGVPAYQGCPVPDADHDLIPDPDDRCVYEPETDNNYQDEDGCPDEVPEAAKPFDGIIEGIFFDTAKSTIKAQSRPKLDRAVEVLEQYPDLRIEIAGHTDSQGDDAFNLKLSRDRAEAVKRYLTDRGIDGSRIRTRGAGETEPVADNDTKEGRAQNRRIEFHRVDR